MSIKALKYGKRLGLILAGVLIGTTFGISNFASGAEEVSRGFARPGFNRPAFNRPAFNRPAFNRPAFNRPAVGQLPANIQRPFIPQRPIVRPVINPVVQEIEDPCVIDEDVVLGLEDACVIVVNED